jgi:4-amino-4-deoxy-L-arabinose transferase-like glycosyltransferase
MRRALLAVALVALACLLVRSARLGLAGDYIDPISKITVQDEALYAHSAISMAREGDWLTPRFMGRYALYKPPLLIWAAALSTRIFGITHLALRLPGAILSALALGVLFLWAAEIAGWQAGVITAVFLLSNHLWFSLSTLCLSDAFLVAFYVAAFYALFCDPWLESPGALWGFAGAVAAAILTKGIAGILPLAVLALYWLAARPKERPSLLRVCLAGALAFALAAPWFLYQLVVHYRWFWTEHVLVEILGYGAGAPPQTSRENQAAFYFMRLAATDPLLLAAGASALPGFLGDLRRRTAASVLLACWLLVCVVAVLGWQYRNAAYLLPLIPALALLAGGWTPFAGPRFARWMIVGLAAVFLVKASSPNTPWGLNAQQGTVQPLAPALSAYCEQSRGNTLVIVDMADDLYASALPLARLRYAVVVPGGLPSGPYGMPFAGMGVIVTVDQFNELAKYEPAFRAKLRDWGISTGTPVATTIIAKSAEELGALVAAHPETDFLMPDVYQSAAHSAFHEQIAVAPRYFFLLSRTAVARQSPAAWTCRM